MNGTCNVFMKGESGETGLKTPPPSNGRTPPARSNRQGRATKNIYRHEQSSEGENSEDEYRVAVTGTPQVGGTLFCSRHALTASAPEEGEAKARRVFGFGPGLSTQPSTRGEKIEGPRGRGATFDHRGA